MKPKLGHDDFTALAEVFTDCTIDANILISNNQKIYDALLDIIVLYKDGDISPDTFYEIEDQYQY